MAQKDIAFEYPLFKMKQIFLYHLQKYTSVAWLHEIAFLANFWEWDPEEVELFEFFMSHDTCKVIVLTASGATITTSISTDEYLSWCEDILAMQEP